jgi:PST family polysaccharide transporter
LLAERVLRLGVTLLINAWLARSLGAEQFGEFSFVLALLQFFSVASALGLEAVVVREIARGSAADPTVFGTALMLRGASATAVGLLAILVSLSLQVFDAPVPQPLLIAVVALALPFQAADVIDYLFRGRSRIRVIVTARLVAFAVSALVRLGLLWVDAELSAFVYTIVLEYALIALGSWLCLRWTFGGALQPKWCGTTARALLVDAMPLWLSGFAVVLYTRSDQIFLGQLAGSADLGQYAAAVRLSEIAYFIPVALVAGVAPLLARTRKRDVAAYEAQIVALFRMLWLLGLAVALPTMLLADEIVRVVFGIEYVAAGSLLAIHINAFLFVCLGVGQTVWTVNEGLTALALMRTAAGAVTNLAANAVLIPRMGAQGAAISAVLGQTVSTVFANVLEGRTRDIFRLQLRVMFFLPVPGGLSISTSAVGGARAGR